MDKYVKTLLISSIYLIICFSFIIILWKFDIENRRRSTRGVNEILRVFYGTDKNWGFQILISVNSNKDC